jgi:hypothetical protein
LIMNLESTGKKHALDQNWVRSSRCVPNNNCVEVRVGLDEVGVRDTKNSGGAVLRFDRDGWTSFLTTAVR